MSGDILWFSAERSTSVYPALNISTKLLKLASRNPLGNRLNVRVGYVILRWHRDGTPCAAAAGLNAHCEELYSRPLLRGVLLVNFRERRTHDFVTHAMTGEACVLLRKLGRVTGSRSGGRSGFALLGAFGDRHELARGGVQRVRATQAAERTPTGRSPNSLMWAGLANSYFWIDRTAGVGGYWATQILPFHDAASYPGFVEFEATVYANR